MAKQFLDYTGLAHYDSKIKAWANANLATTSFKNIAVGEDTYAASTLNDIIKFSGSAVSGLTKATGSVTVNLTDEKTTLDGHYSPVGTTSLAVSSTKLSGSIGAGSSIDAVVGVNKDPRGHIIGLTTKTINIPASISDSTVSDTDNSWVDITIVEKGGKLNSVTIDDTAIDALPKAAFKKITVGSTTIEADSAEDTLTLTAGSNITLTPDVTNDKVTIAANMNFSSLDATKGGNGTYVGVTVTETDGKITSVTVDDSGIDNLPKVAFKTITIGSTSIVADSKEDTLTLAAGSNITLTPDVNADKITIAANMDFSSLDATKGAKGTYVGVTVTETNGKITNVTIDDSVLDTKINSLTDSIQGGTHFKGLTSTTISDGSTATVIKIDNADYTAKAGDIVILSGNKKEFIYTGSIWLELGDSSAEAEAITQLTNNLSTLSTKVNGIDTTVQGLPTVAFKTVKVGTTDLVADSAADTLTIVGGSNITLTPDANNDKFTITANMNFSSLDATKGGNSSYVGVTVTQTDGVITSVTVSDTVGTKIQTEIDKLPKVAFKTITVGSTSIVADSAADTLTIEAGSNITLTPDATNDKVTIAASMNFSSLDATKGAKGTYVGVTVTQTDGKITNVTVNDSAIDNLLTEAIPNATIDNLFA
jgi:DNA-binding protein YbaB